jgi:hypothetical protein
VEVEERSAGVVRSAVLHCSLGPTTDGDQSFGLLYTVGLACTLVEVVVAHGRVDKVDIVDHRFVDLNL